MLTLLAAKTVDFRRFLYFLYDLFFKLMLQLSAAVIDYEGPHFQK